MNELLRAIPKVTELYDLPEVSDLREHYASSSVTEWIRTVLEQLRSAILSGEVTTLPTLEELGDRICRVAARESLPSLRPVINATGVILHTNLGRGCLSDRAADAVYDIARGYSTLEYNVEAGHRGSRHDHVEKLLCRLTGAESAMVVNNNAAAVMLILSTLAQGGEVITSRGELVEIGGSFRVPDIMELCGCHLREVGTTNKTHLSDYERAIGEQTRALLKVHTSNYRIVGFTESLPLSDIVALGCRTGLPVVEDLGSGSLVDLEHYGIHDEPTVQNSIRAGVDVVSFSGDKLLGGPQAGIILGKKPYIDRMKRHPLARAIRVDKMTIAALWATLTTYQDLHRAEQEIPTLAMLAVSGEDLRASAAQLCALLKERGVAAEVVAQSGPVGGAIRKDRAETTIRKHQPQRYLDVDKHPARQSYSCVENLDALAERVRRSCERQLRRGDRAEDFPCPDRRGQRGREKRNGGVQAHTRNIVVPRRQRARHHAGKDQGELPPHQAGCARHHRN